MGKPSVLALDLARITGWAYGPAAWEVPMFGCWEMPKQGGEGARFAQFENMLIDAIEDWHPGHIICESPLPLPAQINRRTAWQQIGMRAMVFAYAWRCSIPVSEVSADLVRSELIGITRDPDIKELVKKYCRRHGWMVRDHNAADACMLWAWRRKRTLTASDQESTLQNVS
jgi:hypothetical protein